MPSDVTTVCVLVITSLLYVAALRLLKIQKRTALIPPGPKGIPIAGNIDVPADYQWLYFSRLRQRFGDLLTISIFGRHLVVVNSRKLMLEMTVKRSNIYSERPYFYTFDASGWSRATALLNGSDWKDHRRYFARLFGTKQLMSRFFGLEVKEARRFIRNILRDPEDLDHHVRHFAGAAILQVVYGYTASEGKDSLIEKVDESMAQFSELLKFGTYLVDFFPWLRFVPEWFPGGGWKKTLRYHRKTMEEMSSIPFEMVKERMRKGTAVPCYITELLDNETLTPHQEEVVKYSASALYAGGADTSVSQIHGFFLVMMLKPDVQRKAQAEIDRVIGPDRLPGFSDRDNLPYVEAVLKELTRFHTVIPGGGVRKVAEDDVIDGLLIPESAVIIPNVWEMSHDPETYKDPLEFNPDRFLGDAPELNPREIMFGFGRRICPGQLMADSSIWITCTLALALFDILPTKGSPTELSHAEGGSFTGDPISCPAPFKCEIKPRTEKAEKLIRSIDDESD